MYSHFRTVSNQASVTVASVDTILSAGAQTGPSDIYSGQVVNNDGTQNIDFWIETSYNGTRWARSEWQGGQGVVPGESRQFNVDVSKYRFVRLSGVASGAGSVSSTISAQLGYQTGNGGSNR